MSDDTGGLTLGERIRKIEDQVGQTRTLVGEIAARDRADFVRMEQLARDVDKKVDISDLGSVVQRVSALESSITWAWRTIVGGLIVGSLGVLYDRL